MKRDRSDLTVDHKSSDLQQLEVITDVGGQRKWPDDFKAQVVAESMEPGVVISEVARQHGLRPQQLFTWRNQMRSARAEAAVDATQFAAVVAEPAESIPVSQEPSQPFGQPSSDQHLRHNDDRIEIVLQHAVVRVHGTADAKTLTTVLRSLKAVL